MAKKTEKENFLINKELMTKFIALVQDLIENKSVGVQFEFDTDNYGLFFWVYQENKEIHIGHIMLGLMPHRAQKHFDEFVAWIEKEFPQEVDK